MFRRRRTDLLLHVIAAEMVRGRLHSCRLGQDVREVQECASLGIHIDNRPRRIRAGSASRESTTVDFCSKMGEQHRAAASSRRDKLIRKSGSGIGGHQETVIHHA